MTATGVARWTSRAGSFSCDESSHSPIQNGFLPANFHSQVMSLLERTLVRLLLNLTHRRQRGSQTHVQKSQAAVHLRLSSQFRDEVRIKQK